MSLEAVQHQPYQKKRTAVTYATSTSKVAIFTGETIKTDKISERADDVVDSFKQGHKENMEQIKENIYTTAKQIKKMGAFKYLFGLVPALIEKIDEDINN